MKTYKELEREAYITGNTELANLYAAADDNKGDDIGDLREEVERLRSIISNAAYELDCA